MKKWLLALSLAVLAGCGAPGVQDYRDAQPALDLPQYFLGTTDAWGMFQKRNGEVVKRFKVVIEGRMEGEQLVLDERFAYSDGSTDRRVWRLQRQADGQWRGSAADVIGSARGELAGNALNWRYSLLLPVDGTTYEVDFDDWMFLIDEQVMVNRARMSKFGFELGQVTLFIRKRD